MPVFVKICGLRTAEAVGAAVDAGADAVGFVFAESPRRISVAEAAGLTSALPDSIVRVAVMRHPTQAEWNEVAEGFSPDWIQTDAEDFSGLRIDAGVRRMPVYRDRPGLDADALANTDECLFEAADSGAGQLANWTTAAKLAVKTRLMLAGGLTALNVCAAIRQVRPWGVDVSSGVEKSRGVKDPERIEAFVAAVREMECADAG